MLTLLFGIDWKANSHEIMSRLTAEVHKKNDKQILIVPELISFETERKLCEFAGNQVSRYAEVLSFTRLGARVAESVGHGAPACLDEGGRFVAMASATKQLHSKLKAFAALETKPEFLLGMLDAVDEFKRCCIHPADLAQAAKQAEGSLAQKLEELSLILETYNSICSQGKRDPRDQMDWLYHALCDSDFAQQHSFYVDGFPDYTSQHMQILTHLICNSPNVVISFHTDAESSNKIAFEKAGKTAQDILHAAIRYGIPYEIVNVKPMESPLNPVWQNILQGQLSRNDYIRTYMPKSIQDECILAADRIMDLVENGARYRDVRIVCPDIGGYKSAIEFVFRRCNIPIYISGKEDILTQSVIHTVLSAVDAVVAGFEQKSMLVYLKSALSPLSLPECDRIENYVYVWSVNGKDWLNDWNKNPKGLSASWDQGTEEDLNTLNAIRKRLIAPLKDLHDSLHRAVRVQDMVQGLYAFLEQIHMASRLEEMANDMRVNGDFQSSQVLCQLWEILLMALYQLEDMLGQTAWEEDTFVRLLKLLLSRYSVGTIPSTLDAVVIGDVSTMRCHSSDYLILLGAEEGNLPKYINVDGVLSEQERNALRGLGVPLSGGASDGLQVSFNEIYATFCGARKEIYASCSGQPSFVFKRLCAMSDGPSEVPYLLGSARVSQLEAGALLARFQQQDAAKKLGIEEHYDLVMNSRERSFGNLSVEDVQSLYGHTLNWSASQIDKLAKCRLNYFFEYGLRAKERRVATIDSLEFGTYIHSVMEQVVQQVITLGGFKAVSFETIIELAKEASRKYADEHFSQLDSKRIAYLFDRSSRQISFILEEIYEELRAAQFQPVDVELEFGTNADMHAIKIEGTRLYAYLGGKVDRVDAWNNNGQTYFRVVDYKTGGKNFDYCEVLNGIGLQMLLYLFALEEAGGCILGPNRIPAGVQYFSANASIVSADGDISEEEARDMHISKWKRNGLLLNETDVLYAMEPDSAFKRLPCKTMKDGSVSGDLADREQFEQLKKYIYRYLSKLLDELADGNVEPNPYMRGKKGACTYCAYAPVCAQMELPGLRNYQAVDADRFWTEIDKEMNCRG